MDYALTYDIGTKSPNGSGVLVLSILLQNNILHALKDTYTVKNNKYLL